MTVEAVGEGPAGKVRLRDGRTVPQEDLGPLDQVSSPVERLARGDVDPVEDFANRLDGHLSLVVS